jgi:hypothetical protein
MGAIECDGSLVCIVRSSRLARSLARHSTGSKGMRMVRSAREGDMIIRCLPGSRPNGFQVTIASSLSSFLHLHVPSYSSECDGLSGEF